MKPDSLKRLLPGDVAPPLMLSSNLMKNERASAISFNEISLVVLWNAGCSGCLPAIAKYSKGAKGFGVSTYGVAIMVRDLQRTMEIAGQTPTDAILVHEKIYLGQKGLHRGQVTRDWFEASGQSSVPASFVVDWEGKIVWMGPLDDTIMDVLKGVFEGSWDVNAARQRRTEEVAESDVAHLIIRREITDALVENNLERAKILICEAERERPELVNDKEFIQNKLILLASIPEEIDVAVEYYKSCVTRFSDDPLHILSLTDYVLAKEVPVSGISDFINMALERIEAQLKFSEVSPFFPIRFHFTRARFFDRVGDRNGFQRELESLQSLAADGSRSRELNMMIEKEIENLRAGR
ncbi:hypothetical protein ACJKIH_11890 [Brucella pseudogrignonensis]|uniref:hypothetical protein n=1 Tax=Brucella pseudogrignonensis TaxID=419475 RepID=UPI0038B54BA2